LGLQVVLGNRWQAPMSRPQGQPQQVIRRGCHVHAAGACYPWWGRN